MFKSKQIAEQEHSSKTFSVALKRKNFEKFRFLIKYFFKQGYPNNLPLCDNPPKGWKGGECLIIQKRRDLNDDDPKIEDVDKKVQFIIISDRSVLKFRNI